VAVGAKASDSDSSDDENEEDEPHVKKVICRSIVAELWRGRSPAAPIYGAHRSALPCLTTLRSCTAAGHTHSFRNLCTRFEIVLLPTREPQSWAPAPISAQTRALTRWVTLKYLFGDGQTHWCPSNFCPVSLSVLDLVAEEPHANQRCLQRPSGQERGHRPRGTFCPPYLVAVAFSLPPSPWLVH
jgi:hypothetical protein